MLLTSPTDQHCILHFFRLQKKIKTVDPLPASESMFPGHLQMFKIISNVLALSALRMGEINTLN